MSKENQLLQKKVADRYLRRQILGEGTYGVVYKAFDTWTVAIKKIRLGNSKGGVNFTALREIKLLKELRNPNIIELTDAFSHKGNLHLVFEFMQTDLEAVIRDRNIVLSSADIKSYMQMTLKGLAYCHKKWVLHQDMKPNNLLIGEDGQLKLADFGLARIFGSPDRKFTRQVFARWYRAPELLFGSKQYGSGVDVWAAACIFAELLLRRPFLQVTKHESLDGDDEWRNWNWRSDGGLMLNGAFFTPSGLDTPASYSKASSMVARPALLLITITPFADVLDCWKGYQC